MNLKPTGGMVRTQSSRRREASPPALESDSIRVTRGASSSPNSKNLPEAFLWHNTFNSYGFSRVQVSNYKDWRFEVGNWKKIPDYRLSHFVHLAILLYTPEPNQETLSFLLQRFYNHCSKNKLPVVEVCDQILFEERRSPSGSWSSKDRAWIKQFRAQLLEDLKKIAPLTDPKIQAVLERTKIDSSKGNPLPDHKPRVMAKNQDKIWEGICHCSQFFLLNSSSERTNHH